MSMISSLIKHFDILKRKFVLVLGMVHYCLCSSKLCLLVIPHNMHNQ